ncbi:MAG: MFS transporter [Panacagrimonas sp.]
MPGLVVLMLAGETVFLLPFVVARVFRPTLLDVLGLSNFQLGSAFSVYGVTAAICYLLGGPLADRFSARRLMSLALVATAFGGLWMASLPSAAGLQWLYGYWGVTSILLFWAALMRAARMWGGVDQQGRAYGLLDGGRGLTAAVLAAFTVALLSAQLEHSIDDPAQRAWALQVVILSCSGVTLAVAGLVWWVIPEQAPSACDEDHIRGAGLKRVLRMPGLWCQALIVVCAYVAYKATDNFGLFARDVLGYDDVEAASLAGIAFWMRPVAAVAAGFVAERISGTRTLMVGFALIALVGLSLGMQWLPLGIPSFALLSILGISLGIYAVRGVYFAIMGEVGVPMAATGAAVGVVSVIGFTPDIFAGPLIGYLLDASPGATGHQQVFLLLAGFAALGLVAATVARHLALRRR